MKRSVDMPISEIEGKSKLLYESCLDDIEGLIAYAKTMRQGLLDMRKRNSHWKHEDWYRACLKIKDMLKPTMDTLKDLQQDLTSITN